MATRPQTPLLPQPETLQSAPLPSDRFVPPQRPPSDNAWNQLARGLGAFAQGVSAWEKRQKKENTNFWLEKYNAWRSTHTEQDALKAIKEGKLFAEADPYIGAVIRKDYGYLQARDLGYRIYKDIKEGGINIGDQHLNVERAILERAGGYVEQLRGNPDAMGAFRKGLEAIRTDLIKKNQTARAAAFQQFQERKAYEQFKGAIVAGHQKQGLTGEILMNEITRIKGELGPRMGGGSLDMNYAELDTQLLAVLDELSRDAKYAPEVEKLLQAQRVDLKTRGKIGSFLENGKLSKRAFSILQRARQTQSTHLQAQKKHEILVKDIQSFLSNPHSFDWEKIKDINVVDKFGYQFDYSANERKKAAVAGALKYIRAVSGGRNIPEEIRTFSAAGEKHPEWFQQLENAYGGLASASVKGAGDRNPQAQDSLLQASILFDTLVAHNRTYVEKNMTKEAFRRMSQISALRAVGFGPGEAATTVTNLMAKGHQPVNITYKDLLKAAQDDPQAIHNWIPFLGRGFKNKLEFMREITPAVRTLMETGMDQETATNLVMEKVAPDTVVVNGRMLIGRGNITQDDVTKIIEPTLSGVWKLWGKELGKLYSTNGFDVSGPEDISLKFHSPGVFQVVSAKTGLQLRVPIDTSEGPLARGQSFHMQPLWLTERQVLKAHDDAKTEAVKKQLKLRTKLAPMLEKSDEAYRKMMRK
ncbi:MAG: hypothetical protein ACWGQW_00080 [bacterium]